MIVAHLVRAGRLTRLTSACAGALLLALLPIAAASEETFYETSLVASRRATTLGQARKALRFYETRAAQYENLAIGEENRQAALEFESRAYREASNAAFFLGDLQKARDHGERALAFSNEVDNPRLKLNVLSSLHQVYRDIRDFPKAREIIEVGFKTTEGFSPKSFHRIWWEGVFYVYRGSDSRRRGEYQRALEDYQRALDLKTEYLKTIPPNTGEWGVQRTEHARTSIVLTYARMGQAYLSMGKLNQALEYYEKALQSTEGWASDFSKVNVHQGLGDVHFHRREFDKARKNFEKALQLARRQQRMDSISVVARRIGDVLRRTGKKTEAVASYTEAIEQIESIRSLLSSQGNRQSYFGGGLGAYTGLIETLWDSQAYREAFDYGERVRSRTFLDMLGTKVQLTRTKSLPTANKIGFAESIDQEDSEEAYRLFLDKLRETDPEQRSLMTVEPLNLKQVQALLEPEQTLLEYLVTSDKIFLWVVDKQRVRALTIPLSQKELVAKVQALRSAIADLKPFKEYQAIARDLHQQLVAPAKSFISGKELIIVPHGVLHYMPFQALYSQEGKYLVEDYSVTYLSSSSLMQFTKEKRKTVGQKVFAVGNPNLTDSKPQLPSAELEASEIRRLYSESAVFVKSEGSEEKVKALAPNYDVLHFATHAELKEDDPLSSAILFSKEDKEDGRLEVREIFGMDLKASLVVLSGCETGLGKLSSGDELVGLTRAFIYAGTPSVVASLWKVDDASTAYLMGSFYKNLRTKTKVESLRQAQLEMIRGEVNSELLTQRGVSGIGKLGQTASSAPPDPNSIPISTSHPYFWAPFILVGDGR